MTQTACPLDCYDACAIECDSAEPTRPKAAVDHPMSNGALCALLNKQMHEQPRITEPRIRNESVSMERALDVAAAALAQENPLLWRGSGNLGVMQGVTDLLMDKLGGTLTSGSLCDGAGQAGIRMGRGINRQLPPEQIAQADVVVVWGRNLTVTNSHILPFIKSKKIVVIDPVRTPIAKKADLHIQLRPRSDFYLALLLSRFIIMSGDEDREWLEEHAPDFEEFYEFAQNFMVKKTLETIGLSPDILYDMLELLAGKRVVFLVGAGVQKYTAGHAALWAIDSLAAVLGLFGKEGCGVSYFGESRQGFADPFAVSCPRVSVVSTPFETFKTVLVQGGNPAESMPNSQRVIEGIKGCETVIYFGLYENATSRLADIVIPAKNFLEKEDLRLSYGHPYALPMHQVTESDIGISEYAFVEAMFARLGLEGLESEAAYLSAWHDQLIANNGQLLLPDYELLPYREGFGKEGDDDFAFVDEYEDDFENSDAIQSHRRDPEPTLGEGEYWLLTPKSSKSLNTQFVRGNSVTVSPVSGFENGERVEVVSEYGSALFDVKVSDDLRSDCIVIPSGTIGVNRLTPSMVSQEGAGACYQEVTVRLQRTLRSLFGKGNQ